MVIERDVRPRSRRPTPDLYECGEAPLKQDPLWSRFPEEDGNRMVYEIQCYLSDREPGDPDL